MDAHSTPERRGAVEWTDVPDSEVRLHPDASNSGAAVAGAAVVRLIITGLQPDTTYTFRVKALGENGATSLWARTNVDIKTAPKEVKREVKPQGEATRGRGSKRPPPPGWQKLTDNGKLRGYRPHRGHRLIQSYSEAWRIYEQEAGRAANGGDASGASGSKDDTPRPSGSKDDTPLSTPPSKATRVLFPNPTLPAAQHVDAPADTPTSTPATTLVATLVATPATTLVATPIATTADTPVDTPAEAQAATAPPAPLATTPPAALATTPVSVRDALECMGLSEYADVLVAQGYDDLNFLRAHCSSGELREIGKECGMKPGHALKFSMKFADVCGAKQ